ncbi:MAG: hypothetical protein AAF585_20215 [Verrucomicrobiota bacterium]
MSTDVCHWIAALCLSVVMLPQLLLAEDEQETRDEKIAEHIQRISETERDQKLVTMGEAVSDIDRVCSLTDEQREKFDLAAKGAVEAYLDKWRGKMDGWVRGRARNENGDIDQFLLGMGTVRFGEAKDWAPQKQSIWVQSVVRILNDEQRRLYAEDLEERAKFRSQAMAQAVLADADRVVKFTTDQRKELLPLVQDATSEYWDRLENWAGAEQSLPFYQMGAVLGGVDAKFVEELLSEAQHKQWKSYVAKHDAGWNMIKNMQIKGNGAVNVRVQINGVDQPVQIQAIDGNIKVGAGAAVGGVIQIEAK